MKVIENYKVAIENSNEELLRQVFAPRVHVEIPGGAARRLGRKPWLCWRLSRCSI